MTPEQYIALAVDNVLRDKLIAAQAELISENDRVFAMLAECKREKVQPAKDYWRKQKKLQDKVAALKTLLTPA